MSKHVKKKTKEVPPPTTPPRRSPQGDPVLELRELRKVRAKGEQWFELRVPDVKVYAGEFVALVGESGCGKSTLLDMLGLVLSPTGADVFSLRADGQEHRIMGLSANDQAGIRRSLLGYVLQTGGLLPFLNVLDNILLPCRINRLMTRKPDVLALCERLKISGQLSKKPAFLSGGQRQRVAIARALAHQPPIVLADEPTAAVDKLTAREIRDTFKELTAQMGVTVLMVTHDLDLVAGFADRVFTFDISRIGEHQTLAVCREKTGGEP